MSEETPQPELDEEDRKERKRIKRSAKAKEQHLLRAYSKVAASPDGQTVLLDILQQAGVYRDQFAPQSTELTIHELGRRSLGLYVITKLMNSDPAIYPKLLRQFIDEAQS